jgi:hypothetical protein
LPFRGTNRPNASGVIRPATPAGKKVCFNAWQFAYWIVEVSQAIPSSASGQQSAGETLRIS